MNDIEYMLKTDAREKKAAGRGVYHKRNGSRTKYVSLPSDNMTGAEWKRRNGPVQSYSINGPMTYAQFKTLPHDLAEVYLRKLQSTYRVTLTEIAGMLHVSPTAFSEYLRTHNIPRNSKTGPRKIDPRWPDFLAGKLGAAGNVLKNDPSEEPATAEDTCATEPIVPAKDPVATEPIANAPSAPEPDPTAAPKSTASKLLFEASGTTEQLLDLLMSVFSDLTRVDKEYDIRVHLTEKGSDTA